MFYLTPAGKYIWGWYIGFFYTLSLKKENVYYLISVIDIIGDENRGGERKCRVRYVSTRSGAVDEAGSFEKIWGDTLRNRWGCE